MTSGKVGLFDFVALDRASATPLYRQLFSQIRTAILNGLLKPGSRLPASRKLAGLLGTSRNTVITAYELLAMEEYITPHGAAGTRVADIPALNAVSASRSSLFGYQIKPPEIAISLRGKSISASERYLPSHLERTFAAGLPALEHFPSDVWARCLSRQARRADARTMDYGEITGVQELRRAIANHLASARGFRPDPDQIIVFNSGQAALDLLTRILTDPGDTAWIEDPGYLGARGAFAAAHATILPLAVDREGLIIPDDESIPDSSPKMIYVTPSHQCPTGVTMSLNRRLRLLEVAANTGSVVLEDDYDSEFRYAGAPVSTLWSMDRYERVIYMGTFSKTMFPGLKIGYLVVPNPLVAVLRRALCHSGQSPNKLVQFALADFIDGGLFADHIRKMRDIYTVRKDRFLAALEAKLADDLEWSPVTTGMQQTVFFRRQINDEEVTLAARNRGVTAPYLSRFFLGPQKRSGLFLGFAGANEHDTQKGIETLKDAIDAVPDAIV